MSIYDPPDFAIYCGALPFFVRFSIKDQLDYLGARHRAEQRDAWIMLWLSCGPFVPARRIEYMENHRNAIGRPRLTADCLHPNCGCLDYCMAADPYSKPEPLDGGDGNY